MKHPRILFVGGNSGGHIFPMIAVWHAIQKIDPHAEASFICSKRPEDAEYLTSEGLSSAALQSPRANLWFPLTFLKTYIEALHLIDSFKPQAVFSKGGSLSLPVCLAAKGRHIPIVMHESDTVMGRANALLSLFATTVCTGFPFKLKQPNWVVTGNPIRPEMTKGSKVEGLKITGFSGKRPVLLVYGGSQGSQALNEWTITNVDSLIQKADVIHLTGKGKPGAPHREGYFKSEFAFEDLPHLYAISDLAISRSGSGTIGELAANGIPAILVPLRGLAQDHQQQNAVVAEKSGGCLVMQQSEIKEKLISTVFVTLEERQKLADMSVKMRTLYKPEAANAIAKRVLSHLEKNLPR